MMIFDNSYRFVLKSRSFFFRVIFSGDFFLMSFSTHWHPDVSSSQSQKLQQRYRQKYGQENTGAGLPLAYDAVMVLADAIRRAQSLDRKKIRDALSTTKNCQGITGTITFDANGDPMNKDAVILKYENRNSVFVKSIKP